MQNKPDTEILESFMTTLEAFLLHNGEELEHLGAYNTFCDLISDSADCLKSLKARERESREISDDPHGYGDWREAHSYE